MFHVQSLKITPEGLQKWFDRNTTIQSEWKSFKNDYGRENPNLEEPVLICLVFYFFLIFFSFWAFLFYFFNCYSITVVCLFSPSLHPTPAEPTSTLPHDFVHVSFIVVPVIRDIEVKNNLTIAGGSGVGTVGRGDYRNYYKGRMDKIKGEGGGGEGRWVQLGWGGGMGRKGTQL